MRHIRLVSTMALSRALHLHNSASLRVELSPQFDGNGSQSQQTELPEPTETADYLREDLEKSSGEADND